MRIAVIARLSLFGLVVLMLTAASASSSRARPLFTGGRSARVRGTIVFLSQRDPAGSLYAESAAGGPLRLIMPGTNAEGDIRGSIFLGPVVWSPDGNHFLYDLLAVPGIGGQTQDQMWISDLSGQQRQPVAPDANASWPPSWSPDGRHVAFGRSSLNNEEGIWIADVGGGEHRLTTGVVDDRPVWSPNGRWIAFLGAGTDGPALMVVPALGGRPREVTCCVANAQPAWSPNSKRLAFLSHAERPALYVTDLSGRHVRLIDRAASGPAAWSPNGKWLALARGGPDTSASVVGTWIERPNGRARRRLGRMQPTDDYLGQPPAWSPDSRALAIAAGLTPDIWVLPLTGSPYAITEGGRLGYQNFEPSWQPKNLAPTRLGGVDVSPAIPTDTTVADNVLRATRRVQAIAADGARVVIQYALTKPADQYRSIETWDAGSGSVIRYSGGGGDYQGPAIAGDQLAYPGFEGGGYSYYFLWSATLEGPAPIFPAFCGPSGACPAVGDAVGKGALLVFDTWKAPQTPCQDPCSGPKQQSRLFRIIDGTAVQIASSNGELTPLAVDDDRVLVNEGAGTLAILDSTGNELMKVTAPGMTEATLQGSDLVVHAGQALFDYDSTTGALLHEWPLQTDSTLADAQDGTAVLITSANLELLRLADGRETVVTPPGEGPFHAQLEPSGLFYSYSVSDSQQPGRVAFIPRASLP